MGKIYSATHSDKAKAMKMADSHASRHRGVVCITPSRNYAKRPCTLDEGTGMWTCWAAAHEQRGSCGRREQYIDQGPDGPTVTDGPGPSDRPEPKSVTGESYSDAGPEDYV